MTENKKYYYLKLKDNFFDSDEMKLLESMPDGYKYSNILLKLYLRSLKDDGRLMLNNRIPYSEQMIAGVTGHSVGDVKAALSVFQNLGLIEKLDNGAIYMLDIQNFIGESSTEADRIRKYRTKIQSEKQQIEAPKNKGVQMYNKCTPEIEIEKELEKELDIEKEKTHSPAKAEPPLPYKEIVDYLNQKAGTSYRASGKKTQSLIKARYNESFKLDDFKQVIDNKVAEWKTDNHMAKYLRPETLFGTKFESYLNQSKASSPHDYGGGQVADNLPW